MAVSFEPVPYWQLGAAVAAAAALAALFGAWRSRRSAPAASFLAWLALRWAALGAVVLLLLGPRAGYETSRAAAAPVAVLIDSSASMDLDAGGRSRLELALKAARAVGREVTRAGGVCYFYDFARGVRPWGDRVPDARAVATGYRSRTDGAAALDQLRARYGRGGLAAAAVMSDGVWADAPVGAGLPPCYALAVGDKPPAGKVAVEEITVPAVVMPGTAFNLTVKYSSTYAGTCAVTLEDAAGTGARYRVPVTTGRGEAAFKVVAPAPGDYFYRVRLDRGVGETWVHTRALDRRLKIWYWEMAGDADFAFLRRALAAQAGFDVITRLDVGDRTVGTPGGPPPDADLVVVGNPRAGKLRAVDEGLLERHVANGGGMLLVLTARPVDTAALTGGALRRLSPYAPAGAPTAGGGGALRAAGFPGGAVVAAAPPVASYVWRVGRLKDGAAPAWLAADGTPAFAVMPYGLGRVGCLAAGGLYRWQLTHGGDALTALATAVVLALYNDQAEPLALGRRLVPAGGGAELTVRSALEPTVTCAGPDGETVSAGLTPAGEGLWSAALDFPRPGRYELTARFAGPAGPQVEKASVMAVAPSDESRTLEPRPAVLRALARATGGRSFGPGEADALAAAVAARVAAAPRVKVRGSRVLWPPWLAFGLALALLAAEWATRRRAGLP